MLPKTNRIKKTAFEEISGGFLKSSKNFSARVLKGSKEPKNSRFSCVISKKVSGTAVKRNLIKRRFYSILSGLVGGLKQNINIIFYVRKSATEAPFSELKKEITTFVSEIR